jgi:hypothetical protein
MIPVMEPVGACAFATLAVAAKIKLPMNTPAESLITLLFFPFLGAEAESE